MHASMRWREIANGSAIERGSGAVGPAPVCVPAPDGRGNARRGALILPKRLAFAREMCYNQGMTQRIVALDIGDKRIGVAYSDPFGEYAVPGDTYFRTGDLMRDVAAMKELAERENAGAVVCGLPLNADGTESIQTRKTARFIAALRDVLSIPVYEEDERYTTREARRDLVFSGISSRKDKGSKHIDSLAAAYILEGYLAKSKKENKTMSLKEERNDYENDENIVELIDEDGNTLRYEHVGTIEYKGEWYCFFTPILNVEEADEDEGEEVAVFRLVGDEDDERLETIDDDALLDEVFAEFCNQYEDFEDADEAALLEPDEEN